MHEHEKMNKPFDYEFELEKHIHEKYAINNIDYCITERGSSL